MNLHDINSHFNLALITSSCVILTKIWHFDFIQLWHLSKLVLDTDAIITRNMVSKLFYKINRKEQFLMRFLLAKDRLSISIELRGFTK